MIGKGKVPSKARSQARARFHHRLPSIKGKGKVPSQARAMVPSNARARSHQMQGQDPITGKGKGKVPSKARARSHQRQGHTLSMLVEFGINDRTCSAQSLLVLFMQQMIEHNIFGD